MATIRDVSERAGVSAATVSRVINGTSHVCHDKKLRIEKAIRELNYKRGFTRLSPRLNRNGGIGIVVPELGGPIYASIFQSIEECFRQFGYHIIATSGSNDSSKQKESVEYLLSRRVDAIILCNLDLDDDYLMEIEKRGVPLVILNHYVPELSESCISIDHHSGGRIATQYLLNNGHTQIACISGPQNKAGARARLQGYKDALTSANIEYNNDLVCEGDYLEASGAKAMERILKRKQPFTAVFASNDRMAFGAMQTLRKHGLSVPEDVSLLGFDNWSFNQYITPGITTINIPLKEMASETVQLILQKLSKKPCSVDFVLQPTLVIRDSVQSLAVHS
ncbi:substrate-binding domain-containing protein [Vibrio breoganii]|uniref:LacI family DNA-binding transcriptional regulator n=1 Tax=Vibrio breoganii TaxID=553239 RepID=UPI000302DEA3|nr:substrate-binding domain-containing protein [Vibrio breoganii]MDN3715485.1 substrate-binding domain-containing protein [Vibrio breoganii]OCH77205.1 LacI family transcriptional regulator [Vibrio breoganii]OED96431.1 LacI family transcriptional regulator [Vibrio breoganii ZF-29]OEF87744.1 LacI family transcriptional regulator [Vibrio breoganii 1C10]PMF85180.1 LacI family transcriptional regulator [Vibrio breoganii]